MALTAEQYQNRIAEQLARKVQEEIASTQAARRFLILAGIIAGFLTYWLLLSLWTIALGLLFDLPHNVKVFLALGTLAWLTWHQFRHRPSYFLDFPFGQLDGGPEITVLLPKPGPAVGVDLLDPSAVSGFRGWVKAVFCVAPQLLLASQNAQFRARRLRQLNVPQCAPILGMLAVGHKPVPLDEIRRAYPKLNLSEIAPQIADLDGLQFLPDDPPALKLSAELRDEFHSAVLRDWTPPSSIPSSSPATLPAASPHAAPPPKRKFTVPIRKREE